MIKFTLKITCGNSNNVDWFCYDKQTAEKDAEMFKKGGFNVEIIEGNTEESN
jgi:hypothetical protein